MASVRGSGGGVRIPVRLDKQDAERDAREMSGDLKRSIQPVVDVFGAARTAVQLFGSALSRLRSITSEAIAAGAEQERVETRVLRAIQLRNRFTREDLDLLQRQNAARQQLVGVGDEVQLQLQGTAALLGVQAKDLNRVTEATLGLVEMTGGSLGLNEAIRVTSKLYQGNTAALKEYGLEVRTANEGLDVLGQKFRGVAEGTETFAQKSDRLRANWADLMEALGRTITDNQDVREFIDDLSSTTLEWIKGINDNGPEVQRQISGFVTELRAFGGWVKENKDELLLVTELFLAARVVGAGAGVVRTLRGLGVGGLLRAGGGALAAKFGAGALATAGAVAGGAVAGTAGLFAGFSDVTGISAMRRNAREAEARRRARDTRGPLGAGASYDNSFLNENFGSGIDVEFTDLDFGAGILIDGKRERGQEVTVKRADIEKRQREAAARARAEQQREEDAFLAWLRDRRETRLRIEQLDVEARQRVRNLDAENEVIALQVQREAVEERNRILFEGYRTKEEMDKAHLAQQERFNASMKASIGSGLGDFFATLGGSITQGEQGLRKAFGGFIGAIGRQFGTMLMTLGAAAVAGGTASTVAPWLIPIFGGPPGVGAGLALIAAGGLLTGLSGALGSAISGSGRASAGASSAPRAPRPAGVPELDAGRDAQRRAPTGFGTGGPRVTVLNLNIDGTRGFMVGTADELARALAQLLGGHKAAYGVA